MCALLTNRIAVITSVCPLMPKYVQVKMKKRKYKRWGETFVSVEQKVS